MMMEIFKFVIFGVLFFTPSSLLANPDVDDVTMLNQQLAPCNFTALFNFGDSNSDTGGAASAFYPPASPFGETYFHKPAGRASDGRLMIDFIAGHLGLPFLSPYLDSIGSNYRKGANFATGGATIMRPTESWFKNGVSPFCLELQVEQYTQLKDRTAYYHKANKKSVTKRLPKPQDFSNALFTFDIAQNDIAAGIRNLNYQQQREAVSQIANEFMTQVRNLYQRGARTFWIHNTGPIGCLPVSVMKVQNPAPPAYLDEHGCVKSQNDIALEFNKQLKDDVTKLRSELSGAAITYVDMFSAKYELITNGRKQGFDEPFKLCCGYHGIGYDVWCGNRGNVNGSTEQVFGGSCPNPSHVISWDGVHYTEAANHWMAKRIINGSFSDPPIDISRACHSHNKP